MNKYLSEYPVWEATMDLDLYISLWIKDWEDNP